MDEEQGIKEKKEEPVDEDEQIEQELEEKLPFPNARVVRIIKENLKKPHQVRKEVKIAANILLGEILADIARTMDEEEVFTLSIEHFNSAARKYRTIDLQSKRIERIKKLLEKERAELEETIMQIEILQKEEIPVQEE
ncbi:MAG: hypothetical protein QXP42_04175 [Candidatus Micrarchaeia archaeon]